MKATGSKAEKIINQIKNNIEEDWLLEGESPETLAMEIEDAIIREVKRESFDPDRILALLRDWVRDVMERTSLRKNFPEETDIFLTTGQIVSEYNKLLRKILIDPDTQKPYFLVNMEKPGEGFNGVTIPTPLRWIFSVEEMENPPKLWVNSEKPLKGVRFLEVISASCAGIENLLDIDKLEKNSNFIVPSFLKNRHEQGESMRSQLRRLAMKALAPIFTTYNFEFSIRDIQHQAMALVELSKIPSVNRWHWQGSAVEEYRQIVYLLALTLDRLGEPERSYILFEKLFQCQPKNEKVCFHRARIRSNLGSFDLSAENMERAISINPDRPYFQVCLSRIMEKMPIEDPFSNMGCPEITKMYDVVTEEVSQEEKRRFKYHLETCNSCSRWFGVMEGVKDLKL